MHCAKRSLILAICLLFASCQKDIEPLPDPKPMTSTNLDLPMVAVVPDPEGDVPTYDNYQLQVDFSGVGLKYRDQFSLAVNELNMPSYMRPFSNDDVVRTFLNWQGKRDSIIGVRLRFDVEDYTKRVAGKSHYHRGKRILHLSPYYPIMTKLMRLRQRYHNLCRKVGLEVTRQASVKIQLMNDQGKAIEIPVVMNRLGELKAPQEIDYLEAGKSEFTLKVADTDIFESTGLFTLDLEGSRKRAQYAGKVADFFGLLAK